MGGRDTGEHRGEKFTLMESETRGEVKVMQVLGGQSQVGSGEVAF